MDLISIIVPVYNVGLYLDECIESLLNQSYKNIEIVLVNDGSTDNSGEICNRYAARCDNVEVIHKTNEGLNYARRDGFLTSTGGFIAFVDSDDIVAPDYIEALYKALTTYSADVAVGGLHSFTKLNDRVFDSQIDAGDVSEVDRSKLLKWLIDGGAPNGEGVYLMTVWGKLYSRKVIDLIDWDFSNYRANEDEFWTLQAFSNLERGAVFTSARYYGYRTNPSSITRKMYRNEYNGVSLRKFEFILHLYEKSLEYLGEDFTEPLLRRLGLNLVDFMDVYIDNRNIKLQDAIHIDRILRSYGARITAAYTSGGRVVDKVKEAMRFGAAGYWLRRRAGWSSNL